VKCDGSETVILLAEDEPLVRNLVQFVLSNEGYTVLAANDGQEAREICEQIRGPDTFAPEGREHASNGGL
jgi:CheY-like chemotaxis protein